MPRLNPNSPKQPERLIRAAWRLFHGGDVSVAWFAERFGLARSTARRDFHMLIQALPADLNIPLQGGRTTQRLIAGRRRTLVQMLGGDD